MDTQNNLNILVAEKALELLKKTLESTRFEGVWKKKDALQITDSMKSDIMAIKFSYAEKENIGEITAPIKEKISKLQSALGEGWSSNFLSNAKKENKTSTKMGIAKIIFSMNTLYFLDRRIKQDNRFGVDTLVGKILSVSKVSDSLLICNVDIKRAITVLTNDMSIKEGEAVAVSILPPKEFYGQVSEGMFCGINGVLRIQGEVGNRAEIPLEAYKETVNMVQDFLKH
ncbi:MAG: putative tRNA binding domain protein [Candidatus Methanofastidiosum methylothiophilum]|uniref:Putative tRNA binding domain protein n=1 Tax=Candidatus Methanofastidiosum methylothiophilum TaxID=1705564 RepID=A0A150IMP4_9EURY|nr:MAG: putative tRNA binding domain protein [Candidatus Methanofastidiosum methylthiophilus]KYC47111.1 MAG: putative tRNA binding domain protein [Candidatus Methanofastidiosum methylthiophilus]KYC51231.1 MAG: putative tRNA binding domain protein [Candidatus Methanofastidiosum methylthiophilus]